MFIKSATGIKKLIDTSLVDADSSVVLHTFREKGNLIDENTGVHTVYFIVILCILNIKFKGASAEEWRY